MPLDYNHNGSFVANQHHQCRNHYSDYSEGEVENERLVLESLRSQLTHSYCANTQPSGGTYIYTANNQSSNNSYIKTQRAATVITYPSPQTDRTDVLMTGSATTAAVDAINTLPLVIVAVGSENKAKLKSVEMAIAKLFPGHPMRIHGYTVDSGVSPQPMSDHETMEGARNRARNALKQLLSSTAYHQQTQESVLIFSVGLEGGVQLCGGGDRWFESGWCCVIDGREERAGYGSSGRFELSAKIMNRLIDDGQELAQVIDDLSGRVDVRSGDGAMGVLTNGSLPRAEAYLHGVLFAFAPFISPAIYWQ